MKIVQKSILSENEKKIIWQLRNNEYPLQFGSKTFQEFEMYLENLIDLKHFFLVDQENEINGWAFTFFREEETWFGFMIDNQFQGKGYGTFLLNEMKNNFDVLNGWVIDHENDKKQNGENYKSPLLFYVKNDFEIFSDIRIENEIISAVKINWKNKEL
ncbi:GNAT family N-acetyltransferase [Flavobacterium mesophilum]|uniref:GNAT family N-acetyltransferase n=1 Tax=Flavobacterium mesophilum TaxID=3143495 RepID=UPI0031DCED87